MLVPADDLDVAVAVDNRRIALIGLKPGDNHAECAGPAFAARDRDILTISRGVLDITQLRGKGYVGLIESVGGALQ